MQIVKQGRTVRVIFKAYLASDHVSPATGKTIAITISKNGGSFANPAAGATNATEIANGWYYVDLGTGDTGTVGALVVRGTEGTIDDAEAVLDVQASSYLMDIHFTRDQANAQDEYTCCFYRDGVVVQSEDVSSPTIQVRDRDNNLLVDQRTLTLVGSNHDTYEYDATATSGAGGTNERTAPGTAFSVKVTATIDGAVRQFQRIFSRDTA